MINGSLPGRYTVTPEAMRQRAELLGVLTGLLHELPEAERDAATILVSWAARSIAAVKLDVPDPQYGEAVRLVAGSRRCSTALLQRKLGLGYERAAAIIDELESRGIVGPASGGSKERDVLLGRRSSRGG